MTVWAMCAYDVCQLMYLLMCVCVCVCSDVCVCLYQPIHMSGLCCVLMYASVPGAPHVRACVYIGVGVSACMHAVVSGCMST